MFENLTIADIIVRVITLLIAFTVHELAHAWAALKLGDDTAERMGRITLNPIAHLDPIGTIALILVGFGWAKPVPVNPYNLRGNWRQSMALVALAGPVSNIVMAVIAAIPFRLGLVELTSVFGGSTVIPSVAYFLYFFIYINIILALFNMIPIPPLDGSKILMGILPPELAERYSVVEQYGPILLLLVIFLPLPINILGLLIGEPTQFLMRSLLGFG